MGGTGENRRFWVEFCVKGQHCNEILFHLGHLKYAEDFELILGGFLETCKMQILDWVVTEHLV
jgi:hypothetical protein